MKEYIDGIDLTQELTPTQLIDEQYAQLLLDRCQSGDKESDHIDADDLVMQLLIASGYPKTAKTYDRLCNHFWYA